MRRLTRWLSPSGFLLAGFCFLFTFVTVSCDTPGGYGRAKAGGEVRYTGLDMALGGEPAVDPEHLLPVDQWREDRMPGQPLAFAALVLVIMGLVWTAWRRDPRIRRAGAAAVAAVASLLLLANQARVEAFLVDRVRQQVEVAAPQAQQASDHVQAGNGFLACLGFLLVVCVGNAVGWWRIRRPRSTGVTSIRA
jgi:hypothetical protein